MFLQNLHSCAVQITAYENCDHVISWAFGYSETRYLMNTRASKKLSTSTVTTYG